MAVSMGCTTAACRDRVGWIPGLVEARQRQEDIADRDLISVYVCTGCGDIYEWGETDEEDRGALRKARECCASNWRSLPRRNAEQVEAYRYRKLAEDGSVFACTYCDKVVDREDDECDCSIECKLDSVRECPLRRQRPSLMENSVSAIVACCLWRVADHAGQELVKERIAGGGDPVREVANVLVACGVLTEADLAATGM